MKPALRFQGVSKLFYGKQVLRDVYLEIYQGEFLALAGANGSGKSTLLSLAMGLEAFQEGSIHIYEQNLEDHLDYPKYRLAYVSESVSFPMPVKMREMMGLQALMARTWDQEKALSLARRLNLDLENKWSQVSRGQKMQFAFILAICSEPDILILDEITAVLDASARQMVVDEVRRFASGKRIAILATNIITEVQSCCDRIAMLDSDGKISVETPASIGQGFKKVLARGPQEQAALLGIDHSEVRHNSDGSISVILPSGISPTGMPEDKRVVTAEEVFIFHTRKGA